MKWTKYPETLAAFVAEMDFGVAAPIAGAIEDVVARGLLGYTPPWMEHELQTTTADWYGRRYGWRPEPDDVFAVADVIRAYELAIEYFTEPGGKIILMTPAYGPFFAIPAATGREVIEVPMLEVEDGWEIDYPAIDAAFGAGGRLLVLCNPHNPIGKVYTRQEQEKLAQIVAKHRGLVFADEVHAPFVYDGARHVPFASVGRQAADHVLTATSASKAFNIPGLKCAQVITSNERCRAIAERLGMLLTHGASVPGVAANAAAYRDGGVWFDAVLDYLAGNRHVFLDAMAEHLPGASVKCPESTYFGWIDLGDHAPAGDLQEYLIEHAGVAISNGAPFGRGFEHHIRFNFATSRELIVAAVEAIAAALPSR